MNLVLLFVREDARVRTLKSFLWYALYLSKAYILFFLSWFPSGCSFEGCCSGWRLAWSFCVHPEFLRGSPLGVRVLVAAVVTGSLMEQQPLLTDMASGILCPQLTKVIQPGKLQPAEVTSERDWKLEEVVSREKVSAGCKPEISSMNGAVFVR